MSHVKEESLDVNRLPGIWRGDDVDEYAEAAITSTTAITLHLMGKMDSQDAALLQAQEMWANRDINKY